MARANTGPERAHLGRVASLPCVVCGARPVQVHHVKVTLAQRRIHELTAPLCLNCHNGASESAHGHGDFPTPYEILARAFRALADLERQGVVYS